MIYNRLSSIHSSSGCCSNRLESKSNSREPSIVTTFRLFLTRIKLFFSPNNSNTEWCRQHVVNIYAQSTNNAPFCVSTYSILPQWRQLNEIFLVFHLFWKRLHFLRLCNVFHSSNWPLSMANWWIYSPAVHRSVLWQWRWQLKRNRLGRITLNFIYYGKLALTRSHSNARGERRFFSLPFGITGWPV